jgi:hypothetical protein
MSANGNDGLDMSPEAFRRLGGEMLNLAAEWLANEPRDPLLERLSGKELAALFAESVPEKALDERALLDELREKVLRYSRRNGHPRYFAHVCASPDPAGALADLLASTINQNLTAWRSAPAAATIERLVIRWLDELVGFDAGGTGFSSAAARRRICMPWARRSNARKTTTAPYHASASCFTARRKPISRSQRPRAFSGLVMSAHCRWTTRAVCGPKRCAKRLRPTARRV